MMMQAHCPMSKFLLENRKPCNVKFFGLNFEMEWSWLIVEMVSISEVVSPLSQFFQNASPMHLFEADARASLNRIEHCSLFTA